MADPILIDDGGSLRIRQDPSSPALDTLLDGAATVVNLGPPLDFNSLRVEHHFRDGTNHLHPLGSGKTALIPTDKVTITSFSGHIIQITVTAANVQLKLNPVPRAVVEARNEGGRRIYRITNADFIQTVTHTDNAGVITVVFDNGAIAPNLPSSFTIVVLADH